MTDAVSMRRFKIVVLLSLSCLAKERCDSNVVNSELLYLSTQTHTLFGHKCISVPPHHVITESFKIFKTFLKLTVLDIKQRPGPLLGALQKHVIFPCPSV